MYYVGADVHMRQSTVHILDGNGKLYKRFAVLGRWPELIRRIDAEVPPPFTICYEATCGYGYLYEQLAPRAQRVVVAHPGELRLIFRSKQKHDRIDAKKIATLLFLDSVPAVYVPARDTRQWRALIEFRQRLVARQVAVKNQLQALLREQAIVAPKNLWHGPGRRWLQALPLTDADGVRRDLLLEEWGQQDEKLRRLGRRLRHMADGHPGVRLLCTIPGVGLRTAEAFLAYVDDVRRFGRQRGVGDYFGLVPCQDASGPRNRLGHITRQGPRTVRKLLVEASWMGIRRSPTLRQYFERISHGTAERRKIAIVAVAHHLAHVMVAMLRRGEAWRETAPTTVAGRGRLIRC